MARALGRRRAGVSPGTKIGGRGGRTRGHRHRGAGAHPTASATWAHGSRGDPWVRSTAGGLAGSPRKCWASHHSSGGGCGYAGTFRAAAILRLSWTPSTISCLTPPGRGRIGGRAAISGCRCCCNFRRSRRSSSGLPAPAALTCAPAALDQRAQHAGGGLGRGVLCVIVPGSRLAQLAYSRPGRYLRALPAAVPALPGGRAYLLVHLAFARPAPVTCQAGDRSGRAVRRGSLAALAAPLPDRGVRRDGDAMGTAPCRTGRRCVGQPGAVGLAPRWAEIGAISAQTAGRLTTNLISATRFVPQRIPSRWRCRMLAREWSFSCRSPPRTRAILHGKPRRNLSGRLRRA